MPEAYIYDHVRTPRGRGKADGALHEVTALALATVPLKALKVSPRSRQAWDRPCRACRSAASAPPASMP
jgi:acetyl-CoA acetyltransferase